MGYPVRGRGVLPVGFGYSMSEPRFGSVRCRVSLCTHAPLPSEKNRRFFRGGGDSLTQAQDYRGWKKGLGKILHCKSTDFADPPPGFALIIKLSLLN